VDRITYSREVQTVDFEEEPTGPSEEEIRRRIQAEVEAAQAQREKELKDENDQIVKEIEEQIRG
jgi:dynein intermediate chain